MHRRRLVVLHALAALALAPAALRAQGAIIAADVALNSAFVWRGVTNTNRPVVDPDLSVALPLGARTQLTLGAWTNVEPTRYDGPHDISTLDGAPGPLATQSQLWVEARRAFDERTVTIGATRYLYPRVGDLAATFATNELYALADAPTLFGLGVAPSVAVYVDVQKVRGAYVEGTLTTDVQVPRSRARRLPLTLAATAGYSAGQGADARGVQSAYFARDGFTHADLAATTELDLLGITVAPTAHVILGRDPLVRVASPDRSPVAKVWIGATASWSTVVGRPANAR